MPQDILITPNKNSSTTQGKIDFTGKGASASTITLKVLDDSTLSFEGTAGQLFSITPNLTSGTIFSVNDVSGVPMIDVDASGLVRLAPLGGTTYSNTLYGVPRTVAGSGNSVTIRAADGLTSGAGGSIILQPGQQATTGGNGVVVVRQPGGTAGTDELQIYHDGTHTYFANKDTSGNIYFDVPVGTNPGLFLRRSDFTSQRLKLTAGDIDNLASVYSEGTAVQLRSGTGDVWIRPGSASNYVNSWFATRMINLNGQSGAILRIPGNNPAGILQLYDNADSSGGSIAYPAATPTTLAANTNDLVLNSSAIQRLSASAAYTLTGIAPPATASHVDGRVIWLHNVGSFNITLKHSQSSVAGNQFINENGGDIVLGPNRIVQCTYDGTSTKWRVHGEMYPYNMPTADGTNGQVLTTNGSGTLSWSTATGLAGSGTTNYIVKFTGSTTAGNSIIYDNGTNVGIGTASPNSKLHLYNATGSIALTIQVGAAYAYFINDATDGILASNQGTTGYKFRYNLNAPDNSLYLSSGGYFGIGTTAPNKKLTVAANGADSTINIYKSPDGTINSSQLVAVLGTGSSQSNTGTTGGNEFGILDLSHSGTVRCRLYAYSGGGGSNNYVLDGMSFGQTSAAAGQVVIAPTSASTKGLVVKAAASPTANILEVQNNSGTNLVYVDPTGDLAIGVPNVTYYPSGPAAPLHVTRATTAVSTAIAAWPTYEPDTQTHARITAIFTDGGNGGTATYATGTTNIVQFGEYYTGRVVLMPTGAGGQTPADQNAGAGRDIMLLGGKSDNTAGKTGGRVFIQGGTGFAGAYGSNFGNVILQANGGAVCIGGTSPVSTSPGLDITSDASSQLTGQLMIKRASTNDRFRLTAGVHTGNYAFIQAYENSIGGLNLALQPNSGWVAIGSTSAGAKLQVDTAAAATKGLIVKGAASQSANLQEWQNSAGSVLANIDPDGDFTTNGFISSNQFDQTGFRQIYALRTLPNVVGDFVEICQAPEDCDYFEIVAVGRQPAYQHLIKVYKFAATFSTMQGTIQPFFQSPYSPSASDFELEVIRSPGAYDGRFRLRRTKGTSTHQVSLIIRYHGPTKPTLYSGTGTSTGLTGLSGIQSYVPNSLTALPPVGGTGAGNSISITAGSGVTSGAGGSIILQPGAQATSGGDGSIRFVNPSNTGQYMSVAVSSTQVVFSLTGIADSSTNIQINHNVYLPSKALWCGAATIGNFLISGAMMRATNGTSTYLGSSNGTSTDNINYIWMRQDGHIAWYGDVGLRRDNVGILTVTNGSTGGGSLAYKSNTTNISTATNDLVLNGSAFQRLNCTTACNLTGVAPPSGSHIDGRMMRIYNVGTANLTLKHNSTSSAVANRFCCVQAVDIILAPRDYAELIYDGTDGGLVAGQNNPCWRVA
jgi:hypothetical protein